MTGLGVTFPAIQDDASFSIFSSYSPGDYGVPHTYIIGRDMVIRKDISGVVSEDVLEGNLMDVVYMRDPVDVEMVMDVSDTMNDPSPSDPTGDTKLSMMKQASAMISDFLNDHGQVDDRMGLVWFTDDASEYVNPLGKKLLPIQTNITDLKNQIDAHGTGLCTAMGAGIQKAFDTLSGSTHQRFAIVCTDGMQNIEPKVAQVGTHYEIIDSGGWLCGGHSSASASPGTNIATYNTRLHTIGIGITATYASLLQEIADATNGFYRATNDPETDLDLIYFLDLCNCLAGGSPAIVHHNAGRLYGKECEAVECFNLNRSARKVTAMLSWKRSQKSNLTFWLYAPDGTLLSTPEGMKFFQHHCMMTFYLPKMQNGSQLPHTGQWRMVIRGETPTGYADYHTFIIAEDREIKYQLDYPRKLYEVGDILPIRIHIAELNEPIMKVKDIAIETAQLRIPLTELLAQYPLSLYELRAGTEKKEHQKEPLLMKIESMCSHHRFKGLMKVARTLTALSKGEMSCSISEKGIVVPVTLKQAGLSSFKIRIQCETEKNGPISRVDMVSICVGPGKANPEQTVVGVIETSIKGKAGARITVLLRNDEGHLLGPGFACEFNVISDKKQVQMKATDLLDGRYEIEIMNFEKVKGKGKQVPITLLFRGKVLWNGMV